MLTSAFRYSDNGRGELENKNIKYFITNIFAYKVNALKKKCYDFINAISDHLQPIINI